MLDIKIKKLNKNVQLPKQSTQGAAGMDFYLPQPVRFEPNFSKKVPLGVAVEIPEGHVMLLIPRSSTWATPLRMPNSIGVIDSDYRGEVFEKGKYQKTRTTCSRSCGCKLGAIHRNEKMSKRRAENARYKNQEIK